MCNSKLQADFKYRFSLKHNCTLKPAMHMTMMKEFIHIRIYAKSFNNMM
jgi:hypothetical protein